MVKNLIIYILSLVMTVSLLTPAFSVLAAEEETENNEAVTAVAETAAEESAKAAEAAEGEEEDGLSGMDFYLKTSYPDAQSKLDTMLLYFENDRYAIYGLEETGEAGIKDKTTGQIMLTNPYDVADTDSVKSDDKRKEILSQIVLTYTDSAGTVVPLNSFADAAFASEETKQIKMKSTRTGLRTEYTIGREAVKYIVPHWIEKSAFENDILSYYEPGSRERKKLEAYYTLKDPTDPSLSETALSSMRTLWPCTDKYAIYVLDTGVGNRELLELEGYIKSTYYDSYSKVEEMYEMLNYVDVSAAPALFRFAIEYNLDDMGLEIKLPANSIRYDSSTYTLQSVKFLPYFCAGSNLNKGFTLIPDGSGAITRFEDIADKAFTLSGKLYGRDYSFHSISGSYQETMRLPAFGVMETGTDDVTAGYVAYISEGDAMSEVTADHGGTTHKYSSVYTTFYPKPSDSYVLEGISTSGSSNWTVYSDRRYTGNYTLRIFPITGEDCDYNDMATTVRDYLTATGSLEKMKADDDKSEDVPLYLETFGTIETTQKFAGFPVDVQTPLTTFEQTEEILAELKENGVNNVNVKLTGWYNGGMIYTAPAKLKVEKAIGGKEGLAKLSTFAEENGFSIYPDIDFVYVSHASSFDGFDFKDHSVKTIDGRSAAFRKYSPLYQGFEERGSLIISPTAATEFYADIKDDFSSFGVHGISVGTLGSELSSDHNSDYALNREDVKQMVSNILSEMEDTQESVMVSAGNAYVLPYVDHVLGVSLDSSLNINTSESIPFVGMVLHGNVEFTGSAINLDGDFDYSVLKAIENGANLYFMLSKQNTSELKQFEQFSKYYAIGYDIWKEDLIATYNKFNEAMKKVKYSYITDHKTLDTRVVKVVYENGTGFILNYNTHDVEVAGLAVEAMGFTAFNADEVDFTDYTVKALNAMEIVKE